MTRDPADRERRPNHLQGQTSPYLLQHLYNPVDWHPWGPEALQRAQREQKPIFLSIGYAACHWCHVMERESFEDPDVAAFLNRHFVSIKVDREERPDVDEIYMNAVQLLTGAGGWPLSVFLTPDLRPFYGGTYFPPRDRYGRPGFLELLRQLHDAWQSRPDQVEQSAAQLAEHLQRIAAGAEAAAGAAAGATPIGSAERSRAAAELARRFDPRWGGFGGAPKFPPDGALALLMREHARSGERVPLEMVERTLDGMALGGIYDQLGGGFARYSVDERWLVPHFEKMLYNQALLVPLYVDAWRLTGKALYRRVVEETLDFVGRELTDPGGGFWSSLDADSEGEEGRYYVWLPSEIDDVLGSADGAWLRETYGVTAGGNFEGRNILSLLGGSLAEQAERRGDSEQRLLERLAPLRERLRAARDRRVRPSTDDKVLTAWNGLAITAFARAHQAFGRDVDLRAARRAADFALGTLALEDRLLVSYRDGRAQLNAYLDDYAFLARGLLDLYETCFDPRYLRAAERFARTLIERFADRERGGFYFTSDDHETLLTRNRSTHDGALPSGSGVAAELLLRLAVQLDDPALRDTARCALVQARTQVERMPSAFASLLCAADLAEGPVQEVAIVGDPADPRTGELLRAVWRRYRPRLALAAAPSAAGQDRFPMLRGKQPVDGRPTAYVCRDYACRRPSGDPAELAALLD